MPRPVPHPIRETIFTRHQEGQSINDIAAALNLPERTIRHLVQRFANHGSQGILTSYRHVNDTPKVVQAILQQRQLHPSWGAGCILAFLRRDHPTVAWPCERTVQRYFRKHNLTPAPVGRKPQPHRHRATVPHAVWQMDAAEHIRLQSGLQVSWLRLVDECSGAFLQTTIFPPRGLALGACG
jgi:hypothetical protein